MKTKRILEKSILNITNAIAQQFPELSKYITEMPGYLPTTERVNTKKLDIYYQSLVALLSNYADEREVSITKSKTDGPAFPGYPSYPAADDIYRKGKEESALDPEDTSKRKPLNEKPGTRNEKDFQEDMSGDDLDVPGSELDDQQESVGSEDEENNYYSLGGDNHNDLEED